MSFKDVVIGDDKGSRICSAIRVFDIPGEHSISQNRVSYWISELILDFGMTVYKDTEEGKAITFAIEAIKATQHQQEKEDLKDNLISCLNTTLLSRVSATRLIGRIERKLEEARREGAKQKLREIQEVLGFYDL